MVKEDKKMSNTTLKAIAFTLFIIAAGMWYIEAKKWSEVQKMNQDLNIPDCYAPEDTKFIKPCQR